MEKEKRNEAWKKEDSGEEARLNKSPIPRTSQDDHRSEKQLRLLAVGDPNFLWSLPIHTWWLILLAR